MIHADVRRDALERWLAPHLARRSLHADPGFRGRELPPLLARDARRRRELSSRWTRRPTRRTAGRSCASPRMLAEAGVHAPQVLAQDLEQGFLLLSDLGTRTYLAELNVDSGRTRRAALRRRHRRAAALAARDAPRRAAAVRRGAAAARDEPVSRLVCRQAPEEIAFCRAAAGPGEDLRPAGARARSRSPWSTCTATTCRAT